MSKIVMSEFKKERMVTMKSKIKSRLLSFLMSAAVTLPMFPLAGGAVQTVSAAGEVNGKLTYSFEGTAPGYAQGTISLTADQSGTYKLYWADDNNALEGYYPIAELDISSGNTKTVSMNYHTVIPANATKIIATTGSKANSAAYSVYDIPVNKSLSTVSGNLLYTFSVFSDIHIDTGNKWYVNAQKNFTQALKYSNSKGSDYIVVSGDCVANDFGFDEE